MLQSQDQDCEDILSRSVLGQSLHIIFQHEDLLHVGDAIHQLSLLFLREEAWSRVDTY